MERKRGLEKFSTFYGSLDRRYIYERKNLASRRRQCMSTRDRFYADEICTYSWLNPPSRTNLVLKVGFFSPGRGNRATFAILVTRGHAHWNMKKVATFATFCPLKTLKKGGKSGQLVTFATFLTK